MRAYGYLPDLGNPHDRKMVFGLPLGLTDLPSKAKLAAYPSLRNQGQLPFCVGYGTDWAMRCALLAAGVTDPPLASPAFICYGARELEGTEDSLCGCQIRDAIDVTNKHGACSEDDWPTIDSTATTRPDQVCYENAPNEEIIVRERIDDGDGVSQLLKVKACIAGGLPVVLGISVFAYFESTEMQRTGKGKMPQAGDRAIAGHCICGAEYDDDPEEVKLPNWWGPGWGMNGWFTLPYAFIDDPELTTDIWKISAVGSVQQSNHSPI